MYFVEAFSESIAYVVSELDFFQTAAETTEAVLAPLDTADVGALIHFVDIETQMVQESYFFAETQYFLALESDPSNAPTIRVLACKDALSELRILKEVTEFSLSEYKNGLSSIIADDAITSDEQKSLIAIQENMNAALKEYIAGQAHFDAALRNLNEGKHI